MTYIHTDCSYGCAEDGEAAEEEREVEEEEEEKE